MSSFILGVCLVSLNSVSLSFQLHVSYKVPERCLAGAIQVKSAVASRTELVTNTIRYVFGTSSIFTFDDLSASVKGNGSDTSGRSEEGLSSSAWWWMWTQRRDWQFRSPTTGQRIRRCSFRCSTRPWRLWHGHVSCRIPAHGLSMRGAACTGIAAYRFCKLCVGFSPCQNSSDMLDRVSTDTIISHQKLAKYYLWFCSFLEVCIHADLALLSFHVYRKHDIEIC